MDGATSQQVSEEAEGVTNTASYLGLTGVRGTRYRQHAHSLLRCTQDITD